MERINLFCAVPPFKQLFFASDVDSYAITGIAAIGVSVHPSGCHTKVLYQNE